MLAEEVPVAEQVTRLLWGVTPAPSRDQIADMLGVSGRTWRAACAVQARPLRRSIAACSRSARAIFCVSRACQWPRSPNGSATRTQRPSPAHSRAGPAPRLHNGASRTARRKAHETHRPRRPSGILSRERGLASRVGAGIEQPANLRSSGSRDSTGVRIAIRIAIRKAIRFAISGPHFSPRAMMMEPPIHPRRRPTAHCRPPAAIACASLPLGHRDKDP